MNASLIYVGGDWWTMNTDQRQGYLNAILALPAPDWLTPPYLDILADCRACDSIGWARARTTARQGYFLKDLESALDAYDRENPINDRRPSWLEEGDGPNQNNGLNALNSFNTSTETEMKTAAPPWPKLHPAALYGLPGDVVRLIGPHTESDPVALLCQFLVFFGVEIGHKPTFRVEATDHFMNLFAAMVGRTSRARKGTSGDHIKRLFQHDSIPTLPIAHGLSSGEGLIWQIRDPILKREPIRERNKHVVGYQDVITDPGIDDKRLMVMESEFARVLRVMNRDGNTLSVTIREAWDMGDLRTTPKNNPAVATGAHIGIIGHITAEELKRSLIDTEAANGFGNRFLWICVKRSKLLPEGGNINQVDLYEIKKRVREALTFAKDVGELKRSDSARALWYDAYPLLSDDKPGLMGSMVGRAEAQVLRLSCLYALLDKSAIIERPHLEAALALWQYAEDSAVHIFGDSLGDPLADEILRRLRNDSAGMSRTDLYNAFGRNRKAGEIGAALERLTDRHLARTKSVMTQGAKRPTEMWFATNQKSYGRTYLTNLTHLITHESPGFNGTVELRKFCDNCGSESSWHLSATNPDEIICSQCERIEPTGVPF